MRLLLAALALAAGLSTGAGAGRAADEADARFVEGLAAYDAGDFQTTIEAWRSLAEAGSPDAQVGLADLYLQGLGVAADPVQAAAWYRRAAEAGDAVAQLNLGELYARGLGVPRDLVEAYTWFGLAAEQGRAWAAQQRDRLAVRLTVSERADAEARMAPFRP